MATTLRGSDNFDTAPDGLGKVLQVTQAFDNGATDTNKVGLLVTTSTTFNTVLSHSVVSVGTNSKFRVTANITAYNGNPYQGSIRLMRYDSNSGQSVVVVDGRYTHYSAGGDFNSNVIDFIDTITAPSGTTVTYTVQGRSDNTNIIYFGYGDGGGGPSNNLTVMEIEQ